MELDEKTQAAFDKEQKEGRLPVKSGILKHDLYEVKDSSFKDESFDCRSSLNEKERNRLIEKFKNNIPLRYSSGNRFFCYVSPTYLSDQEWWFDDSHNTAFCSHNWAKENLIDVKDLNAKDIIEELIEKNLIE